MARIKQSALCVAFAVGGTALPAQSIVHSFDGERAGDFFGQAVAGLGDVDADGVDDVVIGAFRDATTGLGAGKATVFSGADGRPLLTFFGARPHDQLGRVVAAAGDFDGDGHRDILLGIPDASTTGAYAGMAEVRSGRDGALLARWHGADSGDQFGFAVAGVGDADGDGHDDILIGARFADSRQASAAGTATLFSGRTGARLQHHEGVQTYGQFGHAVAGAGDVDGDGCDDLLIGAYMSDRNGPMSGSAHVYSGATGLLLYEFFGESARMWFGVAVDGAGDVDFDGFDDVVVGAMWDNRNGTQAGLARVFSGRTGSVLYEWVGDDDGDTFGCAVSAAGDVDGDGFDDVAIAACGDDDTGLEAGSIRVFGGRDGAVIHTWYGERAGDRFGGAIDLAGDVDGDGLADLLVGARGADRHGEDSGSASILEFGRIALPGRERIHGYGCANSRHRRARIGVAGSAELGRTLVVDLRGAAPHGRVTLWIGRESRLALDALGMPSCLAYVLPIGSYEFTARANGTFRSALYLPSDPNLLATEFSLQWLVADPRATATQGLLTSDALRVTVGR